MAGYSTRSLRDKLGITPGTVAYLVDPPADVLAEIGEFTTVERPEQATYLHWFLTTRAGLDDVARVATTLPTRGQTFWISWPKKSSKVPSEITEQDLRDVLLPTGLVDVKVAAVSQVWSGLKFLWRRS